MDKPSLVVVGTGIRAVGQMTTEALAWIRVAEKVLYLVYDPTAADIISGLNENTESLAAFYVEGKSRRESISEMLNRVLVEVRTGKKICLVIFGHPGVFSILGHEAVLHAMDEGFSATMLPAISAEDCLFADLHIDPGVTGCQTYEAGNFLRTTPRFDSSRLLILFQIGVMGDQAYKVGGYDLSALPVMIDLLGQEYPTDHEVIVYEAAINFGGQPKIQRLALENLADAELTASCTLCVPPCRPVLPNAEMAQRLNLPIPDDVAD